MEFDLNFDKSTNVLTIDIGGVLTGDDTIEIFKAIAQHPDFDPEMHRFWDFSHCFLDWDVSDIQNIIRFVESVNSLRDQKIKVACLVADATDESVIEIFFTLANKLARNFHVFSERDEAKAWLSVKLS